MAKELEEGGLSSISSNLKDWSTSRKDQPLNEWTCEDVGNWLSDEGFEKYSYFFSVEHSIDGAALLALTEDDLKQPPIKLPVLGDIKRLMTKINKLKAKDPDYVHTVKANGVDVIDLIQKTQSGGISFTSSASITTSRVVDRVALSSPQVTTTIVQARPSSRPLVVSPTLQSCVYLDPELWKTLLSFVYVFAVFMLTAFVMVIVHDRVPDMQKYPPLPDLFLDNMPYVPWAFAAAECVGMALSAIWCSVLFFHKHR
jgi:hypothetical protein